MNFDDDDDLDDIEPTTLLPIGELPNWAPAEMVDWLRKCESKARVFGDEWNLYVTLVSDERMRPVWDWFAVVGNQWRSVDLSPSLAKARSRSAFGFCFDVRRATLLPGKPGNMTISQRDAYFKKVRFHTEALIDLLDGTQYSIDSELYGGISSEPIAEDELIARVDKDLRNWGAEETGHVVAYFVDQDGVSRLPWTYPESSLLDLLGDVLDWTCMDEGWHANFLQPSWPLANAKGKNVHVTYFTCVLYDRLRRCGLTIPFAHLATTANVALGLDADEQIDEDAARKQVRRHPHGSSATSTPLAQDGDDGHF